YARLRDRLMFASAARAGIAGAAAAFLAGVPAALAGLGVWALVISAYATQVVETLLLVRAAGVPPLAGFDQATYRRLARFGRYIVAGSLTTFLDRRTDDYFVGLFLGPAVLGLYSVAYRVLELVTTVSLRAVERVAFPVLAKLQDAPELVADAVRTSFRFVSFAAFPAFAGLAVVAPELVQVALGDDWNGAAQPLRILALGGFGLATTTVLPSVLRALGRPGLAVAIAAVKGVTIAAAFAVTARWSVEAVAWTFVVGAFLTAPVFLVSVCRLVPLSVRDYVAAGAGALGASLVMVGVLLGAAPVLEPLGPLLRLCASVLIGGLAYVGAASVLAPGRLSELRQRLRSLRAGDARRRLG
ncbi:MAG: oligosaccharide flippase family protein, partial [Gemmatimonadota bacterium]